MNKAYIKEYSLKHALMAVTSEVKRRLDPILYGGEIIQCPPVMAKRKQQATNQWEEYIQATRDCITKSLGQLEQIQKNLLPEKGLYLQTISLEAGMTQDGARKARDYFTSQQTRMKEKVTKNIQVLKDQLKAQKLEMAEDLIELDHGHREWRIMKVYQEAEEIQEMLDSGVQAPITENLGDSDDELEVSMEDENLESEEESDTALTTTTDTGGDCSEVSTSEQ